MSLIAFALRADASDDFAGGSINANDNGAALDLAKALAAGKGTIVVDDRDTALVAQLDTVGPLKRDKVPAKPVVIRAHDFLDVDGLRDLAAIRRVKGAGSASAADIRAALQRQDELVEAGDLAAANNVNASSSSSSTTDQPTTDQAGDGQEA